MPRAINQTGLEWEGIRNDNGSNYGFFTNKQGIFYYE